MPECAARLFVRPFVRSFYPGETSGDRRVPEQNLALVGVLGTRGSRVNVAAPPPPRTKWTRRVPHPVLIGHAASLTPYQSDTPLTLRPPYPAPSATVPSPPRGFCLHRSKTLTGLVKRCGGCGSSCTTSSRRAWTSAPPWRSSPPSSKPTSLPPLLPSPLGRLVDLVCKVFPKCSSRTRTDAFERTSALCPPPKLSALGGGDASAPRGAHNPPGLPRGGRDAPLPATPQRPPPAAEPVKPLTEAVKPLTGTVKPGTSPPSSRLARGTSSSASSPPRAGGSQPPPRASARPKPPPPLSY
jgi:hypothetical protein